MNQTQSTMKNSVSDMLKHKRKKQKSFQFVPFSDKQKKLFTWWLPESGNADKDGIVADGSVRAGKTLIMSLSYILWAMESFQYEQFGMAGKTIGSFRRNVLNPLKIVLRTRGYKVQDKRADNLVIIRKNGVENYFYIFGGKDESSQDLVQGITLAGFFFDEVALMTESFVNQAIARCSIEGRKFWFNCNPDGPFHWFKINFIDEVHSKNLLRLHFTLDDNPSLSEKIKRGYKKMFAGVFYDRFILGLWAAAEGLIYKLFSKTNILYKLPEGVKLRLQWIAIDYGHTNPTTFLHIGLGSDNNIYVLNEYYHDTDKTKIEKSPTQYSKDLKLFIRKHNIKYEYIYIDPSAKGFINQLYEDGYQNLRQAINDVNKGISLVSSLLQANKLFVLSHCQNVIAEFGAYAWDKNAQLRGEDKPTKQFDHAMDAIRYFVNGNRKLILQIVKSTKLAA